MARDCTWEAIHVSVFPSLAYLAEENIFQFDFFFPANFIIHFSWWLSGIPLCICIIFPLSVHLLVDILADSISLLVWTWQHLWQACAFRFLLNSRDGPSFTVRCRRQSWPWASTWTFETLLPLHRNRVHEICSGKCGENLPGPFLTPAPPAAEAWLWIDQESNSWQGGRGTDARGYQVHLMGDTDLQSAVDSKPTLCCCRLGMQSTESHHDSP